MTLIFARRQCLPGFSLSFITDEIWFGGQNEHQTTCDQRDCHFRRRVDGFMVSCILMSFVLRACIFQIRPNEPCTITL